MKSSKKNIKLYDNEMFINYDVREDYDNLFILKKDNTLILFDEKNNIVTVENGKLDYQLMKDKYFEYTQPLSDERCYPFVNLSVKQIVDFSNEIELNDHYAFIAEDYDYEPYNCYLQLLCYMLFLGKQIKDYQKNYYYMKRIGLEVPSVYEYTKNLISKINEYIDANIENDKLSNPMYLLEYIGKNNREYELTRNFISLLKRNSLNEEKREYLINKVTELLEFINTLYNSNNEENNKENYNSRILKFYINKK